MPRSIDTSLISNGAVNVVATLMEAGFEAYVVGGCVRDLILNKTPKDFDVATSATPVEVKALFPKSRIVGRRFQINHVRFGREVVEVATFRGPGGDDTEYSEEGVILNDNTYGTLAEDVVRRDFTINALYCNPLTGEVLDDVDGQKDIGTGRIRSIGDPSSRFREDPVRILRAIRFKSKLGFDIDPNAEQAIAELRPLLGDIPPARLFEEVLKLFMSGHAVATFDALIEYDLVVQLFPVLEEFVDREGAIQLIRLALDSTDQRMAQEKSVTPAFIFAAILWYPYIFLRQQMESEGIPRTEASQDAAAMTIADQQPFISIPKRVSIPARETWHLQSRLSNTKGKRASAVFGHRRFRAAYDFLVLRAEAGEDVQELADFWTEYQTTHEPPPQDERRGRSDKEKQDGEPRRRRNRRKRRSRRNKGASETVHA